MPRYHLNPQTGNPGVCRATKSCPFGDLTTEHYDSKGEAQRTYEDRMAHANAITLASYESNVETYLAKSPAELSSDLQSWIDDSFRGLPRGSKVLELGSGGARDAKYLASLGYQVLPTDAAENFVEHLRAEGLPAQRLNILTDPIPPTDAIYSCGVLHHLTADEFRSALNKMYEALPPGGLLAFSIKEGEGEQWYSGKLGAPTYFKLWTEEQVRGELSISGYSTVKVGKTSSANVQWLNVSAHRKEAS